MKIKVKKNCHFEEVELTSNQKYILYQLTQNHNSIISISKNNQIL